MTDAELRIIEFLMTSDATRPADLPDWLLALLDGDAPGRAKPRADYHFKLPWTHYRLLLRVDNPDARAFYEVEAVNARWSTRELERQINSFLCLSNMLSRDESNRR